MKRNKIILLSILFLILWGFSVWVYVINIQAKNGSFLVHKGSVADFFIFDKKEVVYLEKNTMFPSEEECERETKVKCLPQMCDLDCPLDFKKGWKPVSDSHNISTWKTYKNEEYGFEFKYPDNYKFDSGATSLWKDFAGVEELVTVLSSEFPRDQLSVAVYDKSYLIKSTSTININNNIFIKEKFSNDPTVEYFNYVIKSKGGFYISIGSETGKNIENIISTFKFIDSGVSGDTVQDVNFQGYYTTYIGSAWEETKTCDAFVVTSGDEKMITYFKEMVDHGNAVQRKDSVGNLIINLDFGGLSSSTVNKIKNSTKGNLVEINLQKLKQVGREAPVCYSFFKVLEDTSNWKTYKNEKYGYELLIPNTWKIQDGTLTYECCLGVFSSFEPYEKDRLKSGIVKIQFQSLFNTGVSSKEQFIRLGLKDKEAETLITNVDSVQEIENKSGLKILGFSSAISTHAYFIPKKPDFSEGILVFVWGESSPEIKSILSFFKFTK